MLSFNCASVSFSSSFSPPALLCLIISESKKSCRQISPLRRFAMIKSSISNIRFRA
ncbi:hypothetical protein IC582_000760 [Cucumis melo]